MKLLTLYNDESGPIILSKRSLREEEYSKEQVNSFNELIKDYLIIVAEGNNDQNYQNHIYYEKSCFYYYRPNIENVAIKDKKVIGFYFKSNRYDLEGVLLINGGHLGYVHGEFYDTDSRTDPSYFEDDDMVDYYLGRYPSNMEVPQNVKFDGLTQYKNSLEYISSIPGFQLIER